MPTIVKSDLLTVRRAADVLCMTPSGIRKAVRQGRVRATSIDDGSHGSSLAFRVDDIIGAVEARIAFLAPHEISATIVAALRRNLAELVSLRGEPASNKRRKRT